MWLLSACVLSSDVAGEARALPLDLQVRGLGPYFANVSITQLNHCVIDPDLDAMRGDERFQAMIDGALERLGQTRADLPGEGRLSSTDAAAEIRVA